MHAYVGVDTSCYTTSVASVDEYGIVSDLRTVLSVKQGERGLRQSDGLFQHVRNLETLMPELMKQRMAEKIALAGCSGPERPGSQLEAQQLIDTLFACDNAEFTSDGHKIVSIITLDELDKRF